MFTSRAIDTAVAFESPVIIMMRMPAAVHCLMAEGTSGLAGSLMPTTPTRVSSDSTEVKHSGSCISGGRSPVPSQEVSSSCRSPPSLMARAIHRRGRTAMSWICSSSSARNASLNGTAPAAVMTLVQRVRSTSAAPFTYSRFSPTSSSLERTPIDFRLRSNSRVASLLHLLFNKELALSHSLLASHGPSSAVTSFSASTLSAASVGSPLCLNRSSSLNIAASLHRPAQFRAACSPSPFTAAQSTPCTTPAGQ
mmetsp:Transcript_43949/g.60011  ORF Transcript_43949/g.60011 Transcript_43949/m.60011 type:complete len:252 (+) Transcript_43949:594-1349(+)